ncbi:MAG: formyl transferase [Clostridium sp.]|nr:formyl transferase [Clostridium sp.]
MEMIKRINPRIIISYNYKYIVSSEVIDYVNGYIFNLHISYLPWNRGSSPNYWSFVENTPKGVTIHQMDKGLDTGDIIVQEEMFFDENEESFSSSYQKLNNKIVELFIQNWQSIKDKTYELKKQEGKGSYHTVKDFEQFTRGDIINWNENIADYKRELERRQDSCTSHMEDNQ